MEEQKQELKEFWERYGFYQQSGESYMDSTPYRVWKHPSNPLHDFGYKEHPNVPLDLNNLFKYAVPKLTQEYIELEIHMDYLVKSNSWNVALLDGFYDTEESKYLLAVRNNKDPAQALYQAMNEVRK